VLVHISDPLDKVLPLTAMIDLEEPETGLRMTIDAGSSKKVKRYREEQSKQFEELRQKLRRMRIDTVFLDTDRSFISDLNSFFRYRERKV
jgi:hypothetical protein